MKHKEDVLRLLNRLPWKTDPFSKQSWGHAFHRIAPYVGRIKPAIAHWLIKIFSDEGETVLDPFCGIGTIVLEADLLGRKVLGTDLSPFALAIARAKLDRREKRDQLTWLKKIDLENAKTDLKGLPDFVHEYYHPRTLHEMVTLRNACIDDGRDFLLGCLLGICHGHRDIHLSMRTGYIIPYIPKPVPPREYKSVAERVIRKTELMHRDPVPPLGRGTDVMLQDCRDLPMSDESVDLVVSSPPYYDTLDYVQSNKLRLAVLGHDEVEQKRLTGDLIQHRRGYLDEMRKVGEELWRVMKQGGRCVFVLGDVHKGRGSLRTAKDVAGVFEEIGFSKRGEVADEIPGAKTTMVKFGGEEAIKKKRRKLDRIIILTKE